MKVILVVFGFAIGTILFFLHKKDENRIKATLFLLIPFSLTLSGFVLAIADDYLSQYDYRLKNILKYEKQKRDGALFDSLVGKKTEIAPEYIFVLDVSASTKGKEMRVKMTKSIQDQIDAIIATGRCGTDETTFGVDKVKKEIPYNKLLQVRLLYSLVQLEKLNYNESDLVYSIVYFADQPNKHIPNSAKLSRRIDESFEDVLGQTFEGKNSDFVKLLEYLNNVFFSANNTRGEGLPYRNPFGRKDYIVVFLSDYLHDAKDKNQYENAEKINSVIKQIEDANVNLKLYTILEDDAAITNNRGLIRIDSMLQRVPCSEMLDLRGFENNLHYPVVLSTPFPFFYSNSIYEDSLRSSIVFINYQNISVGLENYSPESRQEYRLYQRGIDRPNRLSNNIKNIVVRRNDTVRIEIFGYIPAPYTSPDIILEDSSKGVQYYLPVVFFKNCPPTAVCIACVIIGIVLFEIVLFAIVVFGWATLLFKKIWSWFQRAISGFEKIRDGLKSL